MKKYGEKAFTVVANGEALESTGINQAKRTAKRLASEGQDVYISFFTYGTLNKGYLNRDGYAVVGAKW